jgi:hypothetical protein
MLAANSPLIAVNYGNIDSNYGTNLIVTRDYGYSPDIVWNNFVDSNRYSYLTFNFNIPGAWEFSLNDYRGAPSYKSYQWKNNSTNSQVVPSAGWYGVYNVPASATVLILSAIPVSSTPTPTVTPTITPTRTQTPTVTPTISVTPTITPTISNTPSITPTITPTITVSRSFNPGAFGIPQTLVYGIGENSNLPFTKRPQAYQLASYISPTLSTFGSGTYDCPYISSFILAPGTTVVDPNIPEFNVTISSWTLAQFNGPDAYGNYWIFNNATPKFNSEANDAGNVPNIWSRNGYPSNSYVTFTLSAGPVAVGLSATSIIVSGLSAETFNPNTGSYGGFTINYTGGPRAIYNVSQTLTKTIHSSYGAVWAGPQVTDGTQFYKLVLFYNNSQSWVFGLSSIGSSYNQVFQITTSYASPSLSSRGIPLSGWSIPSSTGYGSLFSTFFPAPYDQWPTIGYLRVR